MGEIFIIKSRPPPIETPIMSPRSLLLSPTTALASPAGWSQLDAPLPQDCRYSEVHCIGGGSLLLWLLAVAGHRPSPLAMRRALHAASRRARTLPRARPSCWSARTSTRARRRPPPSPLAMRPTLLAASRCLPTPAHAQPSCSSAHTSTAAPSHPRPSPLAVPRTPLAASRRACPLGAA